MDIGESGSAKRAPALNWQDGSTLRWVEQPDVVDAAFNRGEPLVADDPEIRRQGVVALAHVARLHRSVDQRCVDLLRGFPRGNEADDDLWSFVDHRMLPWWLWRYHASQRLLWLVRDRWRR
jgi:hypothetical protein